MLCAQFHVDTRSDDPGPRCGHTLTCVPAESGGQRLIIFGGATALEGDGPSGSTSGIRLAGATSDVHSFDVRSGVWTKLDPTGEGPSPRAAHSAAAVGNMVVVQGGIGPAGLASEDLHVLDLQGTPRWHRVSVKGPGPGQMYAHVISFVAQRFLVVHGGNDGARPLGDSWCLDTTSKPYEWIKMNPAGDIPPARMYAAPRRTVGVGRRARGGAHGEVPTRGVLRRDASARQRRRARRRQHGGRPPVALRAEHVRGRVRGMVRRGHRRGGRVEVVGGDGEPKMPAHDSRRRALGVRLRRSARG